MGHSAYASGIVRAFNGARRNVGAVAVIADSSTDRQSPVQRVDNPTIEGSEGAIGLSVASKPRRRDPYARRNARRPETIIHSLGNAARHRCPVVIVGSYGPARRISERIRGKIFSCDLIDIRMVLLDAIVEDKNDHGRAAH